MAIKVAILGRPNVGKSTLFNRLTGRRAALVDAEPGVTRDRREGEAKLGDLRFSVIDTAGLEEAPPDSLEAGMRAQTARAVDQADVALLVIDARDGVTPMDRHFAAWLRGTGRPIVLVANKCDARRAEAGLLDAYALGFGDPVPISAERGEGLVELYEALRPFVEAASGRGETAEQEPPLQLAIIGRPNVGKSTLINYLVGEARVLTGPEPGVTRDAVAIDWRYAGGRVRLFDTAGMRRSARVVDRLERLSVADALSAVRFAHAVVLVIDATAPLERQDLALARLIVDEGRAPIIAVNKWDLVADRQAASRLIAERLEESMPGARGISVVPLSALTGKGVAALMPAVLRAVELWNRRIATGPLNRWFETAVEEHPPPAVGGRRARLRYITQIKARPPTFVVFASRTESVPESYIRYLVNGIREHFELPGVPIRLTLRKGRNPYTDGDTG